MVKVLIFESVYPPLIEGLEALGIEVHHKIGITISELVDIIHEYDGLIVRSKFYIDKQVIDYAINLKFIARFGAGMDNIDEKYALENGITCLNAPEGNRNAVGEHVLGMILSLFNNMFRAQNQIIAGKWIREWNRGVELSGKTVGIIGYGNMGSSVAEHLSGFNVNTIAYDKYKTGFSNQYVTECSLNELFENTDVLSLHVPLTDETANMVNTAFIQRFKKNIFIINSARGKIVNTEDLYNSLTAGKVLGAALDVLEWEEKIFEVMMKYGSKSLIEDLLKLDNVILTPHIAGWTHESNQKMCDVLIDKIKTFLQSSH